MTKEFLAAKWYTISNIVQKISPWLIMILLTHYLSVEEYGEYSTFWAWAEVLEILVTLRIYSNGYVAGVVKYRDEERLYTTTTQILSLALVGLSFVVYEILDFKRLNINNELMLCMFIYFLSSVPFGIWASKKRINNEYKPIVIATCLYSILGPVLGACTVFLKLSNPILWIIGLRVIIQLVVSIFFFIKNICGGFSIRFAVDILKYNIPLVPYYLSMVLLNVSDRLMIEYFDGYGSTAIYSVAYSISMIIFVISGALNLSLQPWLFKRLRDKDNNSSKIIIISTIIVAIVSFVFMIIAPEIIKIIGGNKYYSAVWIMPPVIISVLVMFIYQQYVNILFYFSKTLHIMSISIFSAVFNIFLNYILIPRYGYYMAGYTTLLSYLVVMLLYLYAMKKISKRYDIEYNNYFYVGKQFYVLLLLGFASIVVMVGYYMPLLRYSILILLIVFGYVKRKRVNTMIREVRGIK